MNAASKNGFLLLDKKPGLTSFQSLAEVKKTFATGKVGHTGTLDKFASGLLLVLVGKGVKLVPLFADCVKKYTATLFFGAETDTLDPEGEVVAEGEIPSQKEVEAALDSFRGEILQSPPAYSAVHINGRRAHELAREGRAPEMKKRPVTIHELELLSWNPPLAEMSFSVSAGTYIRSLARDIALAAGSRAHLSALRRTGIGPFRLEDTSAWDDKPAIAGTGTAGAIRPLDNRLFEALSFPCFFLDDAAAKGFKQGKPLSGLLPEYLLSEIYAAKSSFSAGVFRKNSPDELLGLIEKRCGKWTYAHVFADN